MFIRKENEIISLMPTARWDRPSQLFGYLEEEERVALEPLLGTPLYQHLCEEYERLTGIYVDITATTIKPTQKAKTDPAVPYADVTERLDAIQAGRQPYMSPCVPSLDEEDDVPATDMKTIRLIRICQQIEFYKMLSHKAGLLTVSFNEGGGMNLVSADNYDPADEKAKDRVVKDAFMSAGRAVDSLLLFLEADAKDDRQFTELWQEADAFFLNKDLLFQTASVMQKFSTVRCRMDYVDLVHDIRFCQNTYIRTRIGDRLLKALLWYANEKDYSYCSVLTDKDDNPVLTSDNRFILFPGLRDGVTSEQYEEVASETIVMLRTALAFYVEARRVEIGPQKERMARRDSMTDAQQAMAMACQYIEENIDVFGDAAVGTPIYNSVREREAQAQRDAEYRKESECRRRREACRQSSRKLFTAFPATHRMPEHRI